MRNATAPMDFADLEPDDVASRIASATHTGTAIRATPYRWPDPRSLPTRQWLLGHWLLRGEVTAIIAPGGTGKSTIGTALALSLASGQPLLGKPLPRGPQSAWIYNLEDSQDELDRQVSAACLFHGIGPEDCEDRLCVDSGLIQPLCTATEDRDGFALADGVFAQVAATVRERAISVVIVDPFVSSHAVRESSNEAIDAIAKRWKRLAQETGCAVVLVHHTRKLGDREVTAEDGRGASALPAAARVVLTLNRMTKGEANRLDLEDRNEWKSLVRIDTGKANRAPPDTATWIKLESQDLGNGAFLEVSDKVAVARIWQKPETEQLLPEQIGEIQSRVAAGTYADNVQAKDWVGHVIADVLGLCAGEERQKLQAIQRHLIGKNYLKVERQRENGRERPFVIVGKPPAIGGTDEGPHLENRCGAESAESAAGDP
jgi:hypothetical protein